MMMTTIITSRRIMIVSIIFTHDYILADDSKFVFRFLSTDEEEY